MKNTQDTKRSNRGPIEIYLDGRSWRAKMDGMDLITAFALPITGSEVIQEIARLNPGRPVYSSNEG